MKALDALVDEFAPKVGVKTACAAFGVNERSHRHRRQRDDGRGRVRPPMDPNRARRPHPAALVDAEKDVIVDTLCSDRFCDLAPAQVYPTLLDECWTPRWMSTW